MEKQKQSVTRNIKTTGAGAGAFAVASVLFSSHAGGGFATGNQATQYYVKFGWTAPIMAVIAMALLTLTIRECMIMYNSRGLGSYKELFQTLYHPFDKLSVLFDVYFYTMVICAVGAVIAGAASLLSKTYSFPYAFAVRESSPNLFQGILKAFTYAGFQSVVIPTMISCGTTLKSKRDISRSMMISFAINSFALVLSVIMLLGWYGEFTAAGESTLPSLYVTKQLGKPYVYWAYNISLFLCLISTGVTTIFGFVSKFEKIKILSGINKVIVRRIIVSSFIMMLSMGISMVGLDKIIKYGYGYMGYLGIAIIIVPFLTVGVYKNRKYLKENSNNTEHEANFNTKLSLAENTEC